jgi:hypothetical protein
MHVCMYVCEGERETFQISARIKLRILFWRPHKRLQFLRLTPILSFVPPKRWFTQDLHAATSQKTSYFIVTAVKTSKPTTIICVYRQLDSSHSVTIRGQYTYCIRVIQILYPISATYGGRSSTNSEKIAIMLLLLDWDVATFSVIFRTKFLNLFLHLFGISLSLKHTHTCPVLIVPCCSSEELWYSTLKQACLWFQINIEDISYKYVTHPRRQHSTDYSCLKN